MKSEKKIVIVGNGLAAWLSAAMISYEIKEKKANHRVCIVESKKTLPVGVGEGSIPSLVPVLERLGIDLTKINATYKLGIEYTNWYSEAASPFNKWYHTFSFPGWMEENLSAMINYDNFFSKIEKASDEEKSKSLLDNAYALHFDTHCLTQELKKKVLLSGYCDIIPGTVNKVNLSEEGIQSINLDNETVLKGDYYLDCTGFNRVLISQFDPKFTDYSNVLLCNSALAFVQEPKEEKITFTVATALSSGWKWEIPTTEKTGHGYVYSSEFISEDEATKELLASVGVSENKSLNIKKFAWEPKILERPFIKNCFAIGLSSGFLEPMEALSIDITRNLIQNFLSHLFFHRNNDSLNRKISSYAKEAVDYLAAHYQLSKRSESPFWRYYSSNVKASPGMIKKISDCKHRYLKRHYPWSEPELHHRKDFPWNTDNIFRPHSWIVMLAGMNADR